ncbi:proline dipeptidase [Euryarchaeota archaeon ex4484_162]|nr:MAG: proline dipeptidase [Euryarchaeota archaeon ex4484_162]
MFLKRRIERLFKTVNKDIDAILIKNSSRTHIDPSFYYVTGLNGVFEQGAAIIFPDEKVHVVASQLEACNIKKKEINVHVFRSKKELEETIREILRSSRKIGVNAEDLIYRDYIWVKKILPKAKLIDISKEISKARLKKDEKEVKEIKKACRIASRVAQKIPDIIHDNATELDIAGRIEHLMRLNGAEDRAFETIVAFGKNSALPHHVSGKTRLKKGDFALFDFGAMVNRYLSDITRTFVYGKASKLQREIYEVVKNAQQIGFDALKDCITFEEVHLAVKSYIDKTKFKGKFVHGTGHTLGLAVHDGGRLNEGSKEKLDENIVLTVEPGVYLPRVGGVRIEDDVLIKKGKIEILTNANRELIEI